MDNHEEHQTSNINIKHIIFTFLFLVAMNRTLRSFSSVREALIQFPNNLQLRSDLHRAIDLVKKYDPAGFLPGFLIKTNEAKIGYFASKLVLV